MKLSKIPTDRFIYPSSEGMPEPQPRLDGWIVQQNEPMPVQTVATRHALDYTHAGLIALGLILAILFFGLVNGVTGEASETGAGHRSAWQGSKLVARVQWGAR